MDTLVKFIVHPKSILGTGKYSIIVAHQFGIGESLAPDATLVDIGNAIGISAITSVPKINQSAGYFPDFRAIYVLMIIGIYRSTENLFLHVAILVYYT